MRWGVREVLVVLALAAAVPMGGGAWLYWDAISEQSAAEKEAKTQPQTSDIEIQRECRPLPANEQPHCSAEARRAGEQAKHDVADLEAQKVTAIWTHYMGVAALVGTAFGLFGIILVMFTFWENRRAADAAHDANRAWIEGEKPHNVVLEFTAEGLELTADIGLVNHGNSPATNVMVVTKVIAVPVKDSGIGREGPAPKDQTNIRRSGIERAVDEYEGTHKSRGKIVYPGKPDVGIVTAKLGISQIREAEGDPPQNCCQFVTVGISYRFGGRLGRTITAYLMIVKGHDHLMVAPFNIPENMTHRVSGSTHIELIDTLEGYAT